MGLSGTATVGTLTEQLDEARALVKAQAEQIKTLLTVAVIFGLFALCTGSCAIALIAVR